RARNVGRDRADRHADARRRRIWRRTLRQHVRQWRQGFLGLDGLRCATGWRNVETRWRGDAGGTIFHARGSRRVALQAARTPVRRCGLFGATERALPAADMAAADRVT